MAWLKEWSEIPGCSDFTKLTFQAQRLAGRWSLLAGVNGQVAGSPLLVSEEYAVGGDEQEQR